MKRKKGYYSISVVAKMFSVHQQTIRMYEKEGLFAPKRSTGNTRLFSEEDVDRLEEIIYLTHKLGVNLAGVEMILKLKKRISKLQEEMNSLLKNAQIELENDAEDYKQDVGKQAQRLMEIKTENIKKIRNKSIDVQDVTVDNTKDKRNSNDNNNKKSFSDTENSISETTKSSFGDWKIEYEEDI
ncbi:MAG: Transcriptional regulator (MerR family) [candidate division TM6 bacterium GW2011_GWF2_37_49]|nr:MAG: Transcriptional regulator (MerR family) [candidate division TM6 bacterium GW2011_GWF2_37_49]